MSTSEKNTLIYDSSKRGNLALDELREVYNFRNLVFQLARRDILTRYKRSVLGIAWTLLNPLGMMIVLTIAFSQVFRFGSIQGYPTYVLSGLLAWTYFSQTTTASMVNLVWGGGLLNRIYIPRTSFALAAITTGLVNITLSTIPLLLVMLITGVKITPALIFLPVPILLLAAFSLGVGLLISTIAVYFPDVAEMYQIFLTGWMYLTPVIYPVEILPENSAFWITTFNPMYYFVTLYRIPIFDGRIPTLEELLPALGIALFALVLGWYVFANRSDEFAYRI